MLRGLFRKQSLPPKDNGEADAALERAVALKRVTEKKQEMRPDEFADAVRQALEVRPT